MKAILTSGLLLLLAGASVAHAEEALFKYKGKAYAGKDLTPPQQQQLHDLQLESWMRLEQFTDQMVLDLWLDEQAKKEGKPRAEVEQKLLKADEPTEKETKEWWEANKGRLPPQYTYEQVVGEIRQHLGQEKQKKKRDELVAKAKADGGAQLLVAEPVGPLVKIDTLGYPVKGPKSAKVTIVEFADYQCPHCKAAAPVLDKMVKKYDGKVAFVFMDYPINQSGVSKLVAHGAYCAEQQGKYWEWHDLAYEKQHELLTGPDAPDKLATELKLDLLKFKECYATNAPKDRVEKAKAEGDRIGLTGTPSIFINGRRVRGYDEPVLEKEIDRALKGGAS